MLSDMPICFSLKIMSWCHSSLNALKIAIHLVIYAVFFIQRRKKTLWPLPHTSNMSQGHILRSHYVVLICSNLISAPDTNLNPVDFDWNSVDSVLMPNKCIVALQAMYTVTCGCKKKCTGRCRYSNVWRFFYIILASATEKNIVPKSTNRLTWTLHKICKYQGFLWAKCFRIWRESKNIYRKYVPENTRVFAYFTQCDVFHLLAQKKLYGPFFYGSGSTASRLQPLRGGSLLFTIQLQYFTPPPRALPSPSHHPFVYSGPTSEKKIKKIY